MCCVCVSVCVLPVRMLVKGLHNKINKTVNFTLISQDFKHADFLFILNAKSAILYCMHHKQYMTISIDIGQFYIKCTLSSSCVWLIASIYTKGSKCPFSISNNLCLGRWWVNYLFLQFKNAWFNEHMPSTLCKCHIMWIGLSQQSNWASRWQNWVNRINNQTDFNDWTESTIKLSWQPNTINIWTGRVNNWNQWINNRGMSHQPNCTFVLAKTPL